jgi:hypothetical protein
VSSRRRATATDKLPSTRSGVVDRMDGAHAVRAQIKLKPPEMAAQGAVAGLATGGRPARFGSRAAQW